VSFPTMLAADNPTACINLWTATRPGYQNPSSPSSTSSQGRQGIPQHEGTIRVAKRTDGRTSAAIGLMHEGLFERVQRVVSTSSKDCDTPLQDYRHRGAYSFAT
jgi:hypothetical protein